MSMNLKCNRMDLWQTPTWVTYVCMSLNDKGKPDGGHKGVARRYVRWVRSHAQGVFREPGQLESVREDIVEHLVEFDALKGARFYVQ